MLLRQFSQPHRLLLTIIPWYEENRLDRGSVVNERYYFGMSAVRAILIPPPFAAIM